MVEVRLCGVLARWCARDRLAGIPLILAMMARRLLGKVVPRRRGGRVAG